VSIICDLCSMGWYFVAKVIQSVLASHICYLRAGVLFWGKSDLQGVSGNHRNPPRSAPGQCDGTRLMAKNFIPPNYCC